MHAYDCRYAKLTTAATAQQLSVSSVIISLASVNVSAINGAATANRQLEAIIFSFYLEFLFFLEETSFFSLRQSRNRERHADVLWYVIMQAMQMKIMHLWRPELSMAIT